MTTLATAPAARRFVRHDRSKVAIPDQGVLPFAGPSGLFGQVIETEAIDGITFVYVDFGRAASDKGAVSGWADAHLAEHGALVDAYPAHEGDEVWAFKFDSDPK